MYQIYASSTFSYFRLLKRSTASFVCSTIRSLSSVETSVSNDKLPSEARVVIGGGGIIGCSIAYHLAKAGWKDVVILEQGR